MAGDSAALHGMLTVCSLHDHLGLDIPGRAGTRKARPCSPWAIFCRRDATGRMVQLFSRSGMRDNDL